MQLSAMRAEFAFDEKTMFLSDGMTIVFSDGFRAQAQQLFAKLDIGTISTNGPVTATSPMGNIDAGNLRVEMVEENGEEKRMIWFEDGVRLDLKTDADF